MYMTLQELSGQYSADAERFAGRIRLLEEELKQTANTAQAYRLQQRIEDLRPMLRQSRAMAQLTQHYYDRGYRKNEAYRI